MRVLALLLLVSMASGCGINCPLTSYNDDSLSRCIAKYGQPRTIKCYSYGGVLVAQFRSTGEVLHGEYGRTQFIDSSSNQAVTVYGCMTLP